ncbi:hypothetical protein ACOMHN_008615 [Nucella lapillus]
MDSRGLALRLSRDIQYMHGKNARLPEEDTLHALRDKPSQLLQPHFNSSAGPGKKSIGRTTNNAAIHSS